MIKTYSIETYSFNGNHEVYIRHNNSHLLYITSAIVLMLACYASALESNFSTRIKVFAVALFTWGFFKYMLPVNEKLTVLPNHGLLYERRNILRTFKESQFIAKQDIQCVVINEIFTDRSSVVPMLCVLHKDKKETVTVIFKNTRPRLDDLKVVYNICYNAFS